MVLKEGDLLDLGNFHCSKIFFLGNGTEKFKNAEEKTNQNPVTLLTAGE